MKRIGTALGGVALAAGALVPPSAGVVGAEPTGLWPSDFAARQAADDCGAWKLDENRFCVANDVRNGLELGVRFRTSQEVAVTGVRIYRVDTAALRTSLWDSDGTLLARGSFAPGGGNRWQDMRFDQPVTIQPGHTYVASYFSPATKYAFRYGYFSDEARTVGPVTALRSVDGSPNGVYCYDDAPCGSFPVRGHRGATYWVTPLWQDGGGGGGGGTTPPPTDPPAPPPTDPLPETGDRRAPRVSTVAPASGARRVKVGATVRATFSEPVRRADLTRSTVRLVRKGSARPVRAAVAYDAGRRRVALDPPSALRPRTAYTVTVSSRVRDVAGNRLDQDGARSGWQDASWTFRTR